MSPVLDVPVDRLATTLAPLRGPRTEAGTTLAPLPVRAAPVGDGTYQVLDGFKRLARWRREGATHVSVVVEVDAFSSVVGKARLLEANTPKVSIFRSMGPTVFKSMGPRHREGSPRVTSWGGPRPAAPAVGQL